MAEIEGSEEVIAETRDARLAQLKDRVFAFCDAAAERGERLTSDLVRRALGGNANAVHACYREWRDARRPVPSPPAEPPDSLTELEAASGRIIEELVARWRAGLADQRQRLTGHFEARLAETATALADARQEADDERAATDAARAELAGIEARLEETQRRIAEISAMLEAGRETGARERREAAQRLDSERRSSDERVAAIAAGAAQAARESEERHAAALLNAEKRHAADIAERQKRHEEILTARDAAIDELRGTLDAAREDLASLEAKRSGLAATLAARETRLSELQVLQKDLETRLAESIQRETAALTEKAQAEALRDAAAVAADAAEARAREAQAALVAATRPPATEALPD